MTETLARLGDTHLLHKPQRSRFRHAARHLVRDARRLGFQVINHADGERVEIERFRFGYVLFEPRLYALDKPAHVVAYGRQLDEVFIGALPIGGLARGDLFVEARLLARVTPLLLGVALDAVEVRAHRRLYARTERVRHIVLDNLQAVDSRFDGGDKRLDRRARRFLFQPLLEQPNVLVEHRYRLALALDGARVGIFHSFLGNADKFEHELVVEPLAHVFV